MTSFSTAPLLSAAGYSDRNGRALRSLIVRANQFALAYREPEKRKSDRKGRKRIDGKQVRLTPWFEKNRNDRIRAIWCYTRKGRWFSIGGWTLSRERQDSR
jgi:hypothetical protein